MFGVESMVKDMVYVFKIALKHRKKIWRRIEIKGNQTLGSLDSMIRIAFNYDDFDHLSEFFPGTSFKSGGYGYIEPGGHGSGATKQINSLCLNKGNILSYIYDFGDNIQHIIALEQIIEPEPNSEYPRIIDQNKPQYRYCESCKSHGKKIIATWICISCSEEELREVLLCENCITKDHDDHFADEILY